jgi:Fur family ferric uptake transcriptional regulator
VARPPDTTATGYRRLDPYHDTMVRNTRQREAIRAAFERADRPLSPAEALVLANEDVPGMGQSTVYRTIAALVDEGWLIAVNLPGQPDRYETAGRRHHHHFHCTLCGGVFEVTACPGDLAGIAPPGFKVHDHEVILTGWCKACAAKAPARPGAGKASRDGQAGHVHVARCIEDGCGEHAGVAAPQPARSRPRRAGQGRRT